MRQEVCVNLSTANKARKQIDVLPVFGWTKTMFAFCNMEHTPFTASSVCDGVSVRASNQTEENAQRSACIQDFYKVIAGYEEADPGLEFEELSRVQAIAP